MKIYVKISIILFLAFFSNLNAIKNWKSYTNTTHMNDAIQIDEYLYISTWGGVEKFNLDTNSFSNRITNDNGLPDNDLNSIEYFEEENRLFLGSKLNGVFQYIDNEFNLDIDEDLGLQSNKINDLAFDNNTLYIATYAGLSSFIFNQDISIPIFDNTFTTQNGLIDNEVRKIIIQNSHCFLSYERGINYAHLDSLNFNSAWHNLPDLSSTFQDSIRINDFYVKGDSVYAAANKGLFYYNLNSGEGWDEFDREEISGKSIYRIYIDKNSRLIFSYGAWNDQSNIIISLEEAAYGTINEEHELELFYPEEYEISNEIEKIFSVNGQLAFLTWGEGLFIQKEQQWYNYKPNCISANYVSDISVTPEGKAWFVNGDFHAGVSSKGTRGVSGFDGKTWTNFNIDNSPLVSDNMFKTAADQNGRVWFGSWDEGSSDDNIYDWDDGVNVYDDSRQEWYEITTSNGVLKYDAANQSWETINEDARLINNTISCLYNDFDNNTWVASSGGGVKVFNENFEIVETKNTEGSNPLYRSISLLRTQDKIFWGDMSVGLSYWNTEELSMSGPQQDPAPSDLGGSGKIYDIAVRNTDFGQEIYFASSLALYKLFNGTWYKFGTSIKISEYNEGSNDWDNYELYIQGQPKLYGSEPTSPSALFVDPFNRIWIGTTGNGLTLYDPSATWTEEFQLFNTDKVNLL